MTPASWLLAVSLAMATAACTPSPTELAQEDGIYFADKDDRNMELAFQQARDGLDGFLATAGAPAAGQADFAVKVGVSEGDNVEYFWVSPFEARDGGFVGTLNNEPRLVSTVSLGEEIAFSRDEIVDWTYDDGGRMKGNFTACAMLKNSTEAERAEFEQRYGLQCGS